MKRLLPLALAALVAPAFSGLSVSGRYARLAGTQRATQYGYSLYE